MATEKLDSAVRSASCIFRGVEYVVSAWFSDESVTIEVEDKLTADQWRGTFDPSCKQIVSYECVLDFT